MAHVALVGQAFLGNDALNGPKLDHTLFLIPDFVCH
jgi:hypothetical protein